MSTTTTPTARRAWLPRRRPTTYSVRTVATPDGGGLRAWHLEVFPAGHPEAPVRSSAGVSHRRGDAEALASYVRERLAGQRVDPAKDMDLFSAPHLVVGAFRREGSRALGAAPAVLALPAATVAPAPAGRREVAVRAPAVPARRETARVEVGPDRTCLSTAVEGVPVFFTRSAEGVLERAALSLLEGAPFARPKPALVVAAGPEPVDVVAGERVAVDLKRVACTTCKARRGAPCRVVKTGKLAARPHKARVDAATTS